MSRRPRTDADRAAHRRKVADDRTWRILIQICRSCDLTTDINPVTGKPFLSCRKHRKVDAKRKAKSKKASR